MTKNNKKGLIFCKLEPLKIDCPDIKLEDFKIELEDIKIELEEIKLSDLTIKDTMKKTELIELIEGLIKAHGIVFEVTDKKIIEEGLRNKKDKETIGMLKKYDEMRKEYYKKIKGGKKD